MSEPTKQAMAAAEEIRSQYLEERAIMWVSVGGEYTACICDH